MRRLCVGARAQRKSNQQGYLVPQANPLNGTRKPYVYGASPLRLRLPVLRWYYNNSNTN